MCDFYTYIHVHLRMYEWIDSFSHAIYLFSYVCQEKRKNYTA